MMIMLFSPHTLKLWSVHVDFEQLFNEALLLAHNYMYI